MLRLQSTIGNAATTQLIVDRRRTVQRRPTREVGLEQKRQYSGFAAEAVDLWRNQPTKTVKEYTEALLTKVNDRLATNGVPRVPGTVDRSIGNEAGGFSARDGRSVSTPPASRPSR